MKWFHVEIAQGFPSSYLIFITIIADQFAIQLFPWSSFPKILKDKKCYRKSLLRLEETIQNQLWENVIDIEPSPDEE